VSTAHNLTTGVSLVVEDMVGARGTTREDRRPIHPRAAPLIFEYELPCAKIAGESTGLSTSTSTLVNNASMYAGVATCRVLRNFARDFYEDPGCGSVRDSIFFSLQLFLAEAPRAYASLTAGNNSTQTRSTDE